MGRGKQGPRDRRRNRRRPNVTGVAATDRGKFAQVESRPGPDQGPSGSRDTFRPRVAVGIPP
ncbi:MAG: hypothetical protein RLZZ322_389 [Verrucomicrobiota bacterium]